MTSSTAERSCTTLFVTPATGLAVSTTTSSRPCHNLKQHNYEPSSAQHHLDPPPKAPRGAS
eukprot:4937478-Prymnesium_polylepis.1